MFYQATSDYSIFQIGVEILKLIVYASIDHVIYRSDKRSWYRSERIDNWVQYKFVESFDKCTKIITRR